MALNLMVSIVYLVKNGGELFEASLNMMLSQKTDFEFEVIVIDSGSTDGSLEFSKNKKVKLFEIHPKEFSFGATRDLGFSKGKGAYLVTLSQDVIPVNNEWLQNIIQPLLNGKTDVVQGLCIPPEDDDIFYWEKKRLFNITSQGSEYCRKYGNISLSCACLALTKVAWENSKFTPAPINEDKYIQRKLFLNGYRLTEAKNALAYHGHKYNLRSLIARCEGEGFGWRYAGVRYTFKKMLIDLLNTRCMYWILLKGILTGELKTFCEIVFLVLKPICVFKGNRQAKISKNIMKNGFVARGE